MTFVCGTRRKRRKRKKVQSDLMVSGLWNQTQIRDIAGFARMGRNKDWSKNSYIDERVQEKSQSWACSWSAGLEIDLMVVWDEWYLKVKTDSYYVKVSLKEMESKLDHQFLRFKSSE